MAKKEVRAWLEHDLALENSFWLHFTEPEWDEDCEQWESTVSQFIDQEVVEMLGVRIPKPGTCVPIVITAKSKQGSLKPPKEKKCKDDEKS